MPNREDTVRLSHMLDAVEKIIEFTKGCRQDDFYKDEKLTLAVIRLIEILGEAGKNVSNQFCRDHPEISWKQIAGARDRLVHGYFDVDLNIVWQIVSSDIPNLLVQLKSILSNN